MADKKTSHLKDDRVAKSHTVDAFGTRGGVAPADIGLYGNKAGVAAGQENLRKAVKEKWQRKTSY